MQQREIGKTKLKIDTLGLGCAPLGGNFVDLTYNQGAELVNAALDAGISYFDTAPWYGFGRSERVVGDQLRNKDIIISSMLADIKTRSCSRTNGLWNGRSNAISSRV